MAREDELTKRTGSDWEKQNERTVPGGAFHWTVKSAAKISDRRSTLAGQKMKTMGKTKRGTDKIQIKDFY
jgi:hypothetical protein